MTAKVGKGVRVRQVDWEGEPCGKQGVLMSLVGMKVNQAIPYLEELWGRRIFPPTSVNGDKVSRSSARVLVPGDVLAFDP